MNDRSETGKENQMNELNETETAKEVIETEKPEEILKVEWFGVDGALLVLFVSLAALYGYGLLNRVDFILGVLAPGIALIITTGVFIKYCTEVFSFAGGKKKDDVR